ncbi:MAG: glycogen synthase [Synergistaceae bacterium]|jgi:starch synthase|nr:glycogen synthase [Synergistaceae bacterium]
MSSLDAAIKVLHVTVEMAPLVKQGGLGDVLGALPKSLRQRSVDARVLLPAFPGVMEKIRSNGYNCSLLPEKIHVALNWRVYSAKLYRADVDEVPVYLLEQEELFANPSVYPQFLSQASVLPFAFLSQAALELPGVAGWKPDIFHVHDWTSSILPMTLRWHKHYRAMRSEYDVVFTIHNLAHQGIVEPTVLSSLGMTRDAFAIDGVEYYGQANLLKGGLVSSDAITTVSPHYSWDIQTPEGGFGLHGVFSTIKGKLSGILNGIDYDVWSPQKDSLIPAHYGMDDMSGKAVCKKRLAEVCRWEYDDKPVVCFIGRLVQQKGIDILFTMFDWLMVDNCRAVVIGSGASQYEDWAQQFSRSYPEYFWCCTDFNDEMAHLAFAGSDITIMPSLFEPCGLSQLIGMSYGSVPVVRCTGGLADTVIDFDSSPDGTGFLFSDYSTDELLKAMYRAIDAYNDKKRWNELVKNAMSADFSWNSSTSSYIDLYKNLRNGDLPS